MGRVWSWFRITLAGSTLLFSFLLLPVGCKEKEENKHEITIERRSDDGKHSIEIEYKGPAKETREVETKEKKVLIEPDGSKTKIETKKETKTD